MKRSLFCMVVMLSFLFCFVSCGSGEAQEKAYQKEGLLLTLPSDFSEKEVLSQTCYYESDCAAVMAVKEDFSVFEKMGLNPQTMGVEDYAKLVIDNNHMDAELQTKDGVFYLEYRQTVNGKDFYYMAVLAKGPDAFWLLNFACDAKEEDQMKDSFQKWAKSISFVE